MNTVIDYWHMRNVRVGVLGLDISGNTRVLRAVTSGSAGLAFLLGGVDRVEPEHVGVVLGPQLVTHPNSFYGKIR